MYLYIISRNLKVICTLQGQNPQGFLCPLNNMSYREKGKLVTEPLLI